MSLINKIRKRLNRDLLGKIDELNSEISTLKTELSAEMATQKSMNRQNELIKDAFQGQRDKYKQQSIELSDFQSRYTNLTFEINELKEHFSSTKMRNVSLENAIKLVTKELQQSVVKNHDFSIENTKLLNENQAAKIELDSLKLENTQLNEKHQNATDEIRNIIQRHDNISKSHEALTETVSTLEKNVDALTAELKKANIENDELENKISQIRIPPLLITTMPRSGTYFLSDYLAQGLSVEKHIVSNQYFPHDLIRYFEIKKLYQNGGVSQDHFDSSDINISYAKTFFDRMVVQTRDPRQAMLSWLHFVSGFDRHNPDTLKFIFPPLPDNFFDLELHKKIDWGIENWLPLLVQWTAQWIKVSQKQDPNFTIKITRFEDLVEDERKFMTDLLDFFSIPVGRFLFQHIDRDEAHHFRKGEIDEWMRIFSPAQIETAESKIPQWLAKKLKWPMQKRIKT